MTSGGSLPRSTVGADLVDDGVTGVCGAVVGLWPYPTH